MSTKTIAINSSVYERLAGEKREGESALSSAKEKIQDKDKVKWFVLGISGTIIGSILILAIQKIIFGG